MNQPVIENKLQRGIDIIDQVVSIALQWISGNRSFICSEFNRVFQSLGNELVSHDIDKWEDCNDFARFYLDMNMNMVQLFFSCFDIPLEPDPYNGDERARIMAQLLEGKNGFDLYPFEAEITRQFYLTGYIHSLGILEDIAPNALVTVKSKNIDLWIRILRIVCKRYANKQFIGTIHKCTR